jgi:hypothetical protein
MTTDSGSPELETLDQLLGGDMNLSVIRIVWPNDARFLAGIKGLVVSGDVLLLTNEGAPVPQWQLRALLEEREVLAKLNGFCLRLTEQGSARVA